jgi:hypothetical protein
MRSMPPPRDKVVEALALDPSLVARCVRDGEPLDEAFATAFVRALTALPPERRRGALSPITGHIAESVAEVTLDSFGYVPLWHHDRTGRHGVDLVLLHLASEMVFAVEVKGTLRPRRWPRLSCREVEQMSSQWLNKSDDPGMRELQFASEDLYGAVVLINFADRAVRVALTADFIHSIPSAMASSSRTRRGCVEPTLHPQHENAVFRCMPPTLRAPDVTAGPSCRLRDRESLPAFGAAARGGAPRPPPPPRPTPPHSTPGPPR